MSGRWSGCCSTGRTGRFDRPTAASRAGALATKRSRRSTPIASRYSIRAAIDGPRCRRSSADRGQLIQIEVAGRLRDGFLPCLPERFFETLRERIAPGLFGGDRFLEERLTARRLLRENLLR